MMPSPKFGGYSLGRDKRSRSSGIRERKRSGHDAGRRRGV